MRLVHITIRTILFLGDFFFLLCRLVLNFFSEFKEAFPAGRFRPICKIQGKRGGSATAVAEQIKAPEW